MKGIATINFKGGVGKTTITWLLAKYAAEVCDKRILVVDTDAQMSLTLAVQLQESGAMFGDFAKWYDQNHRARKRTLLDALVRYDDFAHGKGHFDFPIDSGFIYPMSPNLHFVPSTDELYWLEMEMFDRVTLKNFVRALLGKIEHSKDYCYDYVFFDCPPNFTALSYSVLSCSSLILIPLNTTTKSSITTKSKLCPQPFKVYTHGRIDLKGGYHRESKKTSCHSPRCAETASQWPQTEGALDTP